MKTCYVLIEAQKDDAGVVYIDRDEKDQLRVVASYDYIPQQEKEKK